MTMYEKDQKIKRISLICLNCKKFLGIRKKPKTLNDMGQDFCNMVCELKYEEKKAKK